MRGGANFPARPRRPLLINPARGALVDEDARAGAGEGGLTAGGVFGGATQEPPPPDHILMRLAGRPDVLVTPHVAWASRQAIQGLADQLIDVIEAFVAGKPRNLVGG
ncbi:NAD(P)-dependent oxidoreductase [Nostoc sp. NIES-2111]